MPEGHTIHRHARLQRRHLGGNRVAVSSPQGRFTDGASLLDGRKLETIDAVGKHLFYRWEGDATLHVHLGLFGRFRTFKAEPPAPTEGTRLSMQTADATVYLAGPTACEVIDPQDEETIMARLGPDPLDRESDSQTFIENLSRRRIPIGAALLNQKVIAGIGNVYRAELLFLLGINPAVPSNQLDAGQAEDLWDQAVIELTRGERTGRIVTTDPNDFGARQDRDLKRHERLYAYKRDGQPCRRCDTEIVTKEMANRNIWWCPSCQPA